MQNLFKTSEQNNLLGLNKHFQLTRLNKCTQIVRSFQKWLISSMTYFNDKVSQFKKLEVIVSIVRRF